MPWKLILNVTGALEKYLQENFKKPMRRRLITALGLAAIGMPAILLGGIFYFVLIGTFLIGAAWEYVQLFRAVKSEPQDSHYRLAAWLLILITRMYLPEYAMPVFAAVILIAMAYHLIAYERGRDQAAFDFAITVAGVVYIGWIGAYLVDLRNLPEVAGGSCSCCLVYGSRTQVRIQSDALMANIKWRRASAQRKVGKVMLPVFSQA